MKSPREHMSSQPHSALRGQGTVGRGHEGMLKTTLPPSLSAAAGGRGSCDPRDVNTRWKGKSTQNEMWSHKLSLCLEKCSQNGSPPWRQTSLCSGNKSGPQLND